MSSTAPGASVDEGLRFSGGATTDAITDNGMRERRSKSYMASS
jgi:hypothetical protein